MSKGDTVLVHGRFGESRWTDKSGQEKVKVVYMVDSLQVMRQRVVREVVEVKPVELVKVEVDDTSWMKEEEVAVVAGPVEEKAKSDGAVDDDIPF